MTKNNQVIAMQSKKGRKSTGERKRPTRGRGGSPGAAALEKKPPHQADRCKLMRIGHVGW